MNKQLITYRALYQMALQNDHTEAVEFFKARILEELRKISHRAERIGAIRHMIAQNRERIQHHAAMTRAGFFLKNGFYYASK